MKEKTMSFESRLHDALELKDFAVILRMEKNDPDEYKRRIGFCAQLWHDGRRFTTPPEGDVIALMTHGYDAVMFRGKDCDAMKRQKSTRWPISSLPSFARKTLTAGSKPFPATMLNASLM